MKVRNESEWQGQMAEFAADPNPLALPFRDFLLAWAEKAERVLEYNSAIASPVEALRQSLRSTQEEGPPFSIGFLGMALLVLCSHWEPAGDPDVFFADLTTIEQSLFRDVATIKLAELNAAAQAPQP